MISHRQYEFIDAHLHPPETLLPDNNICYLVNSLNPGDYDRMRIDYRYQTNIVPCWGIHPRAAGSLNPASVHGLFPRDYTSPFIGECGLDFHWISDRSTWRNQKEVFREVLKICETRRKIPCIHTKGAESQIPEILGQFDLPGILIHWYSGPAELLQSYIDLDCYFTIGPDVIPGRNSLWRLIPRERILVETDYPGGYEWICGKAETAEDIRIIYKALADRLKTGLPFLQNLVHNNFNSLLDRQKGN